MNVNARTEYACLAMMELAKLHGESRPARLPELAENHNIPQRFLVQIMLQMKSAGLVTTRRGSSGGYLLAREPEAITLADIMQAVERLEQPESPRPVSPALRALHVVWRRAADAQMAELRKIKLTDLIPNQRALDYVI